MIKKVLIALIISSSGICFSADKNPAGGMEVEFLIKNIISVGGGIEFEEDEKPNFILTSTFNFDKQHVSKNNNFYWSIFFKLNLSEPFEFFAGPGMYYDLKIIKDKLFFRPYFWVPIIPEVEIGNFGFKFITRF